ncbi:PIN domain-like protein [Mycena maculata]|uniref:PIN domain-like protein n=1 Tax=Mycena maculata TaxID=230809 RepID=A0AAD7KB29_9AGAR|nr:PIN domain-like protein [Mycena maculata]
MGIPKLWSVCLFFLDCSCSLTIHQVLLPTAETRSLLNLSTIRGFNTNNRGLRTLIVGDDIRQIPLFILPACLRARGGNQIAALETLFYQYSNFQEAPVTLVAVFDGPGRPAVKRGIRRIRDNPLWVTTRVKELLTALGLHFYTAPGEAEAELAQLNKLGFIDAIITEDSDAIVFGAKLLIRTTGLVRLKPYVTQAAQIYASESISSHPLCLDEDGLLIFALLVGGDYDDGLPRCGPKIAHGLARCGFGRDLRWILTNFAGAKQEQELVLWRVALANELRTNSSGLLDKRHRKLAVEIPEDFPNLDVVELYMDPLTSWSSRFTGTSPDTSSWIPREPNIGQVSAFCINHFGWEATILDRLKSNLWPTVALRMIFSV